MERRQLDQLKYLGLAEKRFKRGPSDITLWTDLDPSRVLAVVAERPSAAADQLWETLSAEPKAAVAVDMGGAVPPDA